MTEFTCAIESAGRAGTHRCGKQCTSCFQQFLKRDDGRPLATVETAGGSYFDYADPRPSQITLDDVAHHLSLVCRFGGATVRFGSGAPILYSVAEHALLVRELVVDRFERPDLGLAALHHDSHEYMLGDWPTPLKRQIRAAGVTMLDELVAKTNVAIGDKFGVDPALFDDPVVKDADALALYMEAATFKLSQGIGTHWGRTEPATRLHRTCDDPPWAIKERFIQAHDLDGGL